MLYGFDIEVSGNAVEQMKKIEAGAQSMSAKAKTEVDKVKGVFSELSAKVKHVFTEFKDIAFGATGIGAAFAGFEFLKSSKEYFDSYEKSVANLHQTLVTMHGASALTERDMQNIAQSINKVTVFSKSAIIEAEGMLATFGNIKGGQFKETMESTADYAAKFFGGNMTEAAKSLGIALDDPIKGMMRLHRQGVSFSAEQKEQIKNFQQQGQLVKAQEIVLKEIRRETGGQAQAFAQTDEGKVIMGKKQWEDVKLQLGEAMSKLEVSLLPALTKIMKVVKEAFDSAPVQFFLEHIKDLVSLVLKLVPAWLIYKATMLAVNAVHKVQELGLKNLLDFQKKFNVSMEEGTVTAGGFKIALMETGVGAFAVALGLITEKFMALNEQMNESIDKITHMKELSEGFKGSYAESRKINEQMGIAGTLSKDQKQDLYNRIQSQISTLNKQYTDFTASWVSSVKKAKELDASVKGDSSKYMGAYTNEHDHNAQLLQGVRDDIEQQKHGREDTKRQIANMNTFLERLQKMGVKPGKNSYTDGFAGSAFGTASLGGASGGLGEAKVVNIHIGTMQKVSVADGHKLKEKGQEAVEVMVRTLNNIAFSQSTTQ